MDATSLIPLMLLAPLIGGILLAFLPHGRDGLVRGAALAISLITFAMSLGLACLFFAPEHQGHLVRLGGELPWMAAFGIAFRYGIDSISLWLILLTTFLMPLVVLGSFSSPQQRVREFFAWLLVLEAAMLGVFVATDLIFFYVCFEFTLVPMYFLIGIYGSTQRLKAARVFFLYTFTGSMLTFAGVLYVAWDFARVNGEWDFSIPALYVHARMLTSTQQAWVLAALLAGFAVKVPLFPVHTWLPLAHTEAPTAGSVILAGVLLKLGTYGLLRFALPLTPVAAVAFAPWIATFAIVGILYTALICWVQKDIKKLIAYSSVSHLGFCVLGLFALNTLGITGSVLYMVNHGLSTGALFLCVGMVYERFHTRQMRQMGGLAKVMPVWSFFLVFFALASVGLPGLNGFVSEFLALLGAFTAADLGIPYAAIAAVGMIFGAIYILYMVGKVVFGPVVLPEGHGQVGHGHGHGPVRDLNAREIATLAPLALACLFLGLYPRPVIESLRAPIQDLVQITNREVPVQTVEVTPAFPVPQAPPEITLTAQLPLEGSAAELVR